MDGNARDNDIYDDKRTAHTFNFILNGRWHTGETPDIPGQLNIEYRMVQLSGMNPDSRVLDFGCGQGLVSHDYHVLSRGATVYGVTNNKQQLAAAIGLAYKNRCSGVNYHLVKEQKLPYKDETFDIITCTESLCHIGNRTELFREFLRVLKPKGQIVLEDWFHCQPDSRHAGKINRAYGTRIAEVKTYQNELVQVGFKIMTVEPIKVNWTLSPVSAICRTAWYRYMYPKLIMENPFPVNKNLVDTKLIEAGKLLEDSRFYLAIVLAMKQ